MPGKARRLGGREIVAILESFGFAVLSQHGSHVKLRRVVGGSKQTLVVPLHKELKPGTFRGIFKQASSYIPTEKLRAHFYAD